MSENLQDQRIPGQRMSKASIQCGACNAVLDIDVVQPKILNLEGVTLIIFEHNMRVICGQCHAELIVTVNQLPGLGLLGILVKKPLVDIPDSRIIVPGAN